MKTQLIVVTVLLLVGAAPATAQWVDPTTCSWADASCQQANKDRSDQNAADDAWYEEQAQKQQVEREQLRRALLKQPALPAERNGPSFDL